MKQKLLTLGLIVSSLFGYLEWGQGQHSFLFQAEWEVLQKLLSDPFSAAHPLTLIPLAGQLLLVIVVIQKNPRKILLFLGIGSIGLLLLLMLFIGVISLNWRIILGSLPFVGLSVYTLIYLIRKPG